MRKFYQQVDKYQRVILTGFLTAFVLCLFCQKLIAVDYDMNDYLPKDSPSTIALETMDTEICGRYSECTCYDTKRDGAGSIVLT